MDKFIASTVTTCKKFQSNQAKIERGKLLEKIEADDYQRFAHTDDGISPRSKLGLENGIFWNTGDESDTYGHISEDPVNRVQMMDKRLERFTQILENIPKDEQVLSHSTGELTVISWGSTKGPIIDAIEMLKNEGINIGFIQLKLLHPFPKETLESLLKDCKTLIDIESNQTAQLGSLIKQNMLKEPDYYVLKYTGRAMTCNELYESLKKIVNNNAEKKEILTYGA